MTAAFKRLPIMRAKRLEPGERPDTLPPESAPPTEREPAPKARATAKRQAKVLPKVTRASLEFGRTTFPPDPEQRLPSSREDCRGGPRPCPLCSCSMHLKYDVHPETGSIWDNAPGVEIEDMAHTCALDLADAGPRSLEEIGEAIGMTKQGALLIEAKATAKIVAQADRLRDLFDGFDFDRAGGK